MNSKRLVRNIVLLSALITVVPMATVAAAPPSNQVAHGGPKVDPTLRQDPKIGTLTDPSSRPARGVKVAAPEKPPRVPPHGRMPHEVEEDDGGAAGASISSYLKYNTGWAQTSPKIYVLFWGDWTAAGDPRGERSYLLNFYAGVGGSAWNTTNTQYGYSCGLGAIGCSAGVRITNPAGQLKGSAFDSTPLPTNPTVAQMEAAAQRAANYWGDRSVNAQYVIAMSKGHRDQKSINESFCAWHNYTFSKNYPISYTSLPYIPDMGTTCGANKVNAGTAGLLDGVSILAGHEYVEAMTDPFLNAWFDPDGSENADKCLQWAFPGYFRNSTFTTGTFAVEPNWSNYHFQTIGNGCVFYS